ncbi:HepT-like ribonuclease domain-containing protein [Rufibacter radiotolerans]|uniref:HepT-like ribonuclease domain-containing protein n=1 Tax=Rufibacter radiotolerans TaxID=1379910 RepID=UPI0006646BC5|nr:HepT-like ribonuclease domain-containing protein [Rufibacter radiotolerans]
MADNRRLWLTDIRGAILEIYDFLPEERGFPSFQKDLKSKKAIERNLEIIGEALNRIIKPEPDIAITNARRIINTRNRIIHGYDTVSKDIIWAIVIQDLPKLEEEVNFLLFSTLIKEFLSLAGYIR